MSASNSVIDGKKTFTAEVADESDLQSPVTVSGDGYTVTFAGNKFESKHLRRIRRNSVADLKSLSGADKLNKYTTEARDRSVDRWEGKESSTNSYIYLDLQEYCQFGAKIIRALKSGGGAWVPYGAQNTLQQHITVTLDRCLAYSHSGTGFARTDQQTGRLKAGVGITLNTVVQQVNNNPKVISVCHYDANGTEVRGKFRAEYFKGNTAQKGNDIARSIVN